jgi:hypothetical protein
LLLAPGPGDVCSSSLKVWTARAALQAFGVHRPVLRTKNPIERDEEGVRTFQGPRTLPEDDCLVRLPVIPQTRPRMLAPQLMAASPP